jgi:hypothetical protein
MRTGIMGLEVVGCKYVADLCGRMRIGQSDINLTLQLTTITAYHADRVARQVNSFLTLIVRQTPS